MTATTFLARTRSMSSTMVNLLAFGFEPVHDGSISSTGQRPTQIDDLLQIDVLVLRGGSTSVSVPTVTTYLPSCCRSTDPTASSKESTSGHSMLWLVGCWKSEGARCDGGCSGGPIPGLTSNSSHGICDGIPGGHRLVPRPAPSGDYRRPHDRELPTCPEVIGTRRRKLRGRDSNSQPSGAAGTFVYQHQSASPQLDGDIE